MVRLFFILKKVLLYSGTLVCIVYLEEFSGFEMLHVYTYLRPAVASKTCRLSL